MPINAQKLGMFCFMCLSPPPCFPELPRQPADLLINGAFSDAHAQARSFACKIVVRISSAKLSQGFGKLRPSHRMGHTDADFQLIQIRSVRLIRCYGSTRSKGLKTLLSYWDCSAAPVGEQLTECRDQLVFPVKYACSSCRLYTSSQEFRSW